MPLKIVRNDITKMRCDAIVNTANEYPVVGRGCDSAIYEAAGYDELLAFRQQHIGKVKEGKAFITPAFRLQARYIIHAVSPAYRGGSDKEEHRLRSCYRNSLSLAVENRVKSIAFPLIATGSLHYPKEEGLRIAVDEINAFLMHNDMSVYLVVFDDQSVRLGKKIYPELESYIDSKYASQMHSARLSERGRPGERTELNSSDDAAAFRGTFIDELPRNIMPGFRETDEAQVRRPVPAARKPAPAPMEDASFYPKLESGLAERLKHLSDTFSEYLIYLIDSKGMTNAEVYTRAIVDKKAFSKIKNNRDAHPQKMTAMCLCIGAKLNIDESRDLLARAGYALSPSNKTDVIFSYFIENQIYDMIELDIQLEEHGLPCLIS